MTQAAPQPSRPAAAPAAPSADAAPVVGQASPAGRPTFFTSGPGGTQQQIYTSADIAALRSRKDELSNLLNNATRRRQEVQRSLQGADGANRTGLEQRLAVLDGRIARLETEIDENSSQLASLPAQKAISLMKPTPPPRRESSGMNTGGALAMAFVICVLTPLSIAFSRGMWRRASRPAPPAPNPDTTQRLERIEQSIEAIAIEVERVSEGQRFVTRLMSEGAGAALGAGQAAMEPIAVRQGQPAERL
jgi:hypothetical protein